MYADYAASTAGAAARAVSREAFYNGKPVYIGAAQLPDGSAPLFTKVTLAGDGTCAVVEGTALDCTDWVAWARQAEPTPIPGSGQGLSHDSGSGQDVSRDGEGGGSGEGSGGGEGESDADGSDREVGNQEAE